MLVFESKLQGKTEQYVALDEAIRTAQFIRNSCLKHWMDNKGVSKNDLQKLCAVLAKGYEWANKLNSQARQASADRAWLAISRFFDNCKKKKPGKKGFPCFKKFPRSVEYKNTGWKLSVDRKTLTFTDGFVAGSFKLIGSRDLNFYQISQIKRVRIVRRADGYYAQFCIGVVREEKLEATGQSVGLDVGLTHFYTDSEGNTIDNPRYLRKSEKALKRAQRRVSSKKKGSKNKKKAINKLGRKHLKVSRQRKDFAIKTARCVLKSRDLIAYEDLQVRNMVKNHHLAKSISDASWSQFREWLEYLANVFGRTVIAVPPQYTSQNCSSCGETVKKTLSVRTHICKCGTILDRDHNAALNILKKALQISGRHFQLSTGGHPETLNAWGQNCLWLREETLLVKQTG